LSQVLSSLPILLAASALLPLGCQGQSQQPQKVDAMPAKEPAPQPASASPSPSLASPSPSPTPSGRELATFGAGCFWCVEAVFEQIDGVLDVRSGYMGGKVTNPTYEQVCSGETGHAEVVQVAFDPARLAYDKLLDWFWKLHDPTTLNRQGNDVGTQYRSAIFYHSEEQQRAAEASKQKLGASGVHGSPIVTEIAKASRFYEAEDYHQEYYRLNKAQPYCRFVITPKLEKLGLEK
jgi:peptide-methionine (S)-S-oxide reductase